MSATNELCKRFWDRMASNYGDRWTKAYGSEPTKAWIELLGKYSPNNIGMMLNDLPNHVHLRQFPPTLPQVEAMLLASCKVARAALTEADWRRGYWRSSVVSAVIHELNASGLVRRTDSREFERVMVANRATLGRAMADLLNELDELEIRTGQRTEGIHALCTSRSRSIAGAYHGLFDSDEPEVYARDNGPPEGSESAGVAPF